jgi:subtilisin family serine protease
MQGGVAAHEDIAPNLVAGYDVVDDDADASPNGGDNGLGTHLAGVVAASTLNVCDSTFCGIHGVAPDAKIMPVRFIDSGAAPTRQAYFDRRMPSAISVALDGGARILLDGYSQMIRQYHVRARYDGRWENFNFLGPDQRAYNIKAPLSAQLRRIAAEDAIFIVRAGDQGWQDAQDDGAQRSGRVSVYAGGAPQILRTRDILRPDLLSTAIDLDKDDSGWWASLPSLRNYEFLDGHFIAVMAIDDAARATTTTNGCGDAMNYCLAAPGSFINSYTSDAVVGDANRGADYGLEERSGTGQAAAHVAGAVALLMHKYPMLSAPQISSILLTSAVDLGLAGVDRVFGHGLLSLERALAPLGSLRLANAAGRSFAAEDSFINPGASPAFGGALTDARMPLGYLDSFDRVYAARFGEFVKKHDDGDAAYAALAAAEFSAASGDCAPLLAAAAARTRLLFVAGDGAACEDFPVFARPRAFFADGGNFAFVEHTEALSPAADMRLLFGGGDNLTFAAARVDKRAGKFALAAEAGGWIERRNLLGAEFSGGLKIGGKARTVYSRLAAAWSLAGWKTGASAIAAKTTAATAKDSLVTRIGDIYSLGFALNAANPRGDWEIKISRPLSVVRGALDLEFIGDYNDGGHIPASARLDLAGKPQISASLIRRRPNGAAIAVAVVRRDSALIPAAAFKVEF